MKVLVAAVGGLTTASAAPKGILATPTVVGECKSPSQHQDAENSQLNEKAHSVVLLTLTFTDDGKVSGFTPNDKCKVLEISLRKVR